MQWWEAEQHICSAKKTGPWEQTSTPILLVGCRLQDAARERFQLPPGSPGSPPPIHLLLTATRSHSPTDPWFLGCRTHHHQKLKWPQDLPHPTLNLELATLSPNLVFWSLLQLFPLRRRDESYTEIWQKLSLGALHHHIYLLIFHIIFNIDIINPSWLGSVRHDM